MKKRAQSPSDDLQGNPNKQDQNAQTEVERSWAGPPKYKPAEMVYKSPRRSQYEAKFEKFQLNKQQRDQLEKSMNKQ